MLSSLGGVFGIVLGVAASAGVTALINMVLPGGKWPFVLSVLAAVVALLFAAGGGDSSSAITPPRRASQPDPIERLAVRLTAAARRAAR